MGVDFEAEGLLEGTEGKAREARLQLLEELSEQGVPVDELKRAVAENRLALLPVERFLEGEGDGAERYTASEVGERAKLDPEFLLRYWQALGMPRPDPDQRVFGHQEVEAAKAVKEFRAAGLPDDGILEAARVVGMSMSQVAATIRALIAESYVGGSETERDLALRFSENASRLDPLVAEILHYVFRLHTREQVRQDAIGLAELAEGSPAGSQTVTVAFADLVGFTRLGEQLEPEEFGELSGRLGELAGEIVSAPVRLVKMIGDAVMLVSPENDPLLDAALALVQAADEEGERFPQLHAGVARGEALPRGGDWYGRPINLASRITSIARPGSVLCEQRVREEAGFGYRWSFAGERRLKGISGRVRLFRSRPESVEDSDED